MIIRAAYLLASALLLAPATVFGQQDGVRGRWNVTFNGGASVPTGGTFHEGGRGTVLGLPTSVDAKKTGDVFDAAVGWQAGVGYGVSRNVELFGNFAWNRAEATELSVGNVASLDLRAAFDDYTSYGLDGGLRYHFAPKARISPYVAGLAGFRRVEAIAGTFSVPAAGVTLRDTPFFDQSIVPLVGGDVGVLFGLTSIVSVGVETGLRYHGNLSDIEGLAGTGLENLNDAGSRWSMPISGVVRFGF
jgi:hypothetical protein